VFIEQKTAFAFGECHSAEVAHWTAQLGTVTLERIHPEGSSVCEREERKKQERHNK
jgi:hypothetical protein